MPKAKKQQSSIAALGIATVLLITALCLWLSGQINLLPWAMVAAVFSVLIFISYSVIVSTNDWRKHKVIIRSIGRFKKKKTKHSGMSSVEEKTQPTEIKEWSDFHPDVVV